jgi:hypothetical protein
MSAAKNLHAEHHRNDVSDADTRSNMSLHVLLHLGMLLPCCWPSPHPADDDLQDGPPVSTQQVDLINDQQTNLHKAAAAADASLMLMTQ